MADKIRNIIQQQDKSSVNEAMAEVEAKVKAFTEAHKGEDSEKILAEMRGEMPVSEDRTSYDVGFYEGYKKCKQQMMKDAVDGKIYETQARSKLKATTTGKISRLKFRVGDKIKLIILKEK